MAVAPYASLDANNAVFAGRYALGPNTFAYLYTPNPAEHPPGPDGWYWIIRVHGDDGQQSGRALAVPGTSDVSTYFTNNFPCAIVSITHTPGSSKWVEGDAPSARIMPEAVQDVASAIQFFKLHASDTSVVGAGGKLATDPARICITGIKSGGYLSALSQLMPDGAFPYEPSGLGTDPLFGYQHNHLVGVVRAVSAPWFLSPLDSGSATPANEPYLSYGLFGQMGSFMYSAHYILSGGTWDGFSMGVKMLLEPATYISSLNSRVVNCAWYIAADFDATNAGDLRNLSNAASGLSILNSAHFTRGVADTDFTSAFSDASSMRAAYDLEQAGATRYRLKCSDVTHNPDDGTAAIRNPDLSNSRYGSWRSGPANVEVITNVTYVGTTVTVTFFKAHQYTGGSVVTIQDVVATGTLATALNGVAHTVTATPTANQIQFTVGAGPSGAYTSGGRGYIANGLTNPSTDLYTFLVDATYGANWELL